MKLQSILQHALTGIFGCAAFAGCHGLQKDNARGTVPSQVVRVDRSDLARSGKNAVHDGAPDDQTRISNGDKNSHEQVPNDTKQANSTGVVKLVQWNESDELPSPDPSHQRLAPSDHELSMAGDGQVPPQLAQSLGGPRDSDIPLLSLDELQHLAASTNPTLQQAQSLVQQARGNWLQVGLYPNPSIQGEGAANNAPMDMFNMYVKQDIVTGRKLKLNRAVASHDVHRAQWEAEAQNLRVVNEVQIRYIAALGAQQQVTVAEELLKVAQEGVRISEKLLAGEQVSEADVMQARLQRGHTQILLRNAQFRAAATWKQLGNIVGWPDLPLRPLDGHLEDDVPDVNWDIAYQQLLSSSPLINAAKSRVAAAAVQVRREEAQPTPNLQLTSGVGRDFFTPQYMMYTLQFGFTLPTFNRNVGNVTAAVGELHAAQSEVDRLELSLRNKLASTFRKYQTARNQVITYRDSILPTAEMNLSLTLKQYEAGELDFLRVLTARRDLFEAKIEYVNALIDMRTTAIQIEGLLLTGGLDPLDSNPTPSNHAGQTASPGN
ncbi:TolC family protein [Schlesneria paludicola]|uniref:TolC family protein n=1 Tax=Schlesneria paludicola TaxID=360056 RepID=UPI001ED8DE0D|nr:TolC family protein [Schlesneria paludicola]